LFPDLSCQQLVDRTGGNGGEKHAFGVGPTVAFCRAAADEDGSWSAERDQFMRLDGKIGNRSCGTLTP
jgi:hypothetical protein